MSIGSARRSPSLEVPPDPALGWDGKRDLIIYDGECVLCSGFVRFVADRDGGRFLFASAQSLLGQELYRRFGLNTVDFESNLVLADGRLSLKLEAFAAAMGRCAWPWKALAALSVVPRAVADPAYDLIARNRFRWFGRRESCALPPPGLKDRVVV